MIKKQNSKKVLLNLIFLLIPLLLINPQIKIIFSYKDLDDIRKDKYYTLEPINNEPITISPFDALIEIDETQKHKVLINSLEKSRLTSLFYVGDKYEFNNIEIMLKYKDIYQIKDKLSGFSVSFSLGYYDNIILHSAINFQDKKFNIIDKIASSLAVKLLLGRMTGTLNIKKNFIDANKTQDSEIQSAYENFIDKLKYLNNKEEIFLQLKNYVDLNFRITGKTKITDEWTTPANLYFFKKGDYKSITSFYYYTLKKLGFNVAPYLIAELIKKDKDQLENLYILFSKRNKKNSDLLKIQNIESEYKYVNPASILKYFSPNNKYSKPSQIFFYMPPELNSSVFLLAVEINNKWLYTTGDKWIDAGLYTSERTCSHYARNGCYYAYINKDFIFLNNLPFSDKDVLWDVFYNIK